MDFSHFSLRYLLSGPDSTHGCLWVVFTVPLRYFKLRYGHALLLENPSTWIFLQ